MTLNVGPLPKQWFIDAFHELETAHESLVRALACSKRAYGQWWTMGPRRYTGRKDYTTEGSDTKHSKAQMMLDALSRALNRLSTTKSVIANAYGGTLELGVNDCAWVDNGLKVHTNLGTLPDRDARRAVIAALVCGGSNVRNRFSTGLLYFWDYHNKDKRRIWESGSIELQLIQNAYNIADWVIERYKQAPCSTSENRDWDRRPDSSRRPQLSLKHPYKVGWTTTDWEKSILREAWDNGWPWVESAWRFLYRISRFYFIYDKAKADQMARDMWNFGGRYAVDAHDVPLPNAAKRDSRSVKDPWGIEDEHTGTDYEPSLHRYFGTFSPHHVAKVTYVIYYLALRFQGDLNSGSMDKTNFYIHNVGKRANATPTGGIYFRKNFRNGDLERRTRELVHEMMHYLVRREQGGKPRDKWENVCDSGDDDNNKCYGEDAAVELAFHDRSEAVMNVDNYRYWMRARFRRWGLDWPPHTDINVGDPSTFDPPQKWHNDPIADDFWPDVWPENPDGGKDIQGTLADKGWGWFRDYLHRLVGDSYYRPWQP
jgi:hypothetical protein